MEKKRLLSFVVPTLKTLLFIRARRVMPGCHGQTLLEYALVLTVVSLTSLVAMSFFSEQLNGVYATVLNVLNAVRSAI